MPTGINATLLYQYNTALGTNHVDINVAEVELFHTILGTTTHVGRNELAIAAINSYMGVTYQDVTTAYNAWINEVMTNGVSLVLAPVFQDLFDGTSGVDLTAHTPDVDTVGGGWLKFGSIGDWELDGTGQAKLISAASAAFNVADTGITDCIIKVQGSVSSTGQIRSGKIDTNVTSTLTDGIICGYFPQVALHRMDEVDSGVTTVRDSVSLIGQAYPDITYYLVHNGSTCQMIDSDKSTVILSYNSVIARIQSDTGVILSGRRAADFFASVEVYNTTDIGDLP